MFGLKAFFCAFGNYTFFRKRDTLSHLQTLNMVQQAGWGALGQASRKTWLGSKKNAMHNIRAMLKTQFRITGWIGPGCAWGENTRKKA